MLDANKLEDILNKAIDKTLEDGRIYLQETVVNKFKSAETTTQKFNIVMEFVETVGYDYKNDI